MPAQVVFLNLGAGETGIAAGRALRAWVTKSADSRLARADEQVSSVALPRAIGLVAV
jgi:hypothetical protein